MPAAGSRLRSLAVPGYCLALAAVALGPLLGPGYLLLRDAVSTPRSYLTDGALGIGDAAPRAVPQDALLAVLSHLVDGGVLVKALLLLALWLAGWGAAALARSFVPSVGVVAQLAASTLAIWNPFVAERLAQGHWSLLVGYAALPWTILAARRQDMWALAFCLAAAGLTPTGAILCALTALLTLRRRRINALLLITLASAPWLVATIVSGSGQTSAASGVTAFAARAEPGLGTLGSLAGLGGIWNSTAVPSSRTTLWAVVATAALLALVIAGTLLLRGTRGLKPLVWLAVLGIGGPALAATEWGLSVCEWADVHVPGWALTRDTQKFVALALPLYAVAVAVVAQRLRQHGAVVTALPAIALIAVLPDLAWGVDGALRPVHYPSSWGAVASKLDTPGDVAVLPGGMFRLFPWAGHAPVLDPAPRMLPNDVLQTGDLPVAGRVVAGEGGRARTVEQLLQMGVPAGEIASHGVGWILVEHRTPGPLGDSARTLSGLRPVYDDMNLTLYRLPACTCGSTDAAHRNAADDAHLVWAGLLVLSAGAVLRRSVRTRIRRAR